MRMLKKSQGNPLAVVAMSLAIAVAANAQWDPYPWKRVPRTPDGKVDLNAPAQRTSYGKPDLSGFWLPDNPTKYLLNLAADMKPEDIPLKPWAWDLYNQRIDNNGKDHPGVSCLPSGIPEKDNIPDGLKLVQTEDLTLLLHESRTIYRQIFTDGRPLPKDPQPTWMGYSIGHWDKVYVRRRDDRAERQDLAGYEGAAGNRSAPRHRTIFAAEDRPHGHRGHHRRSGGIHKALEGEPGVAPAAGYRSHRKHLRRKQSGPWAYGREVTTASRRSRLGVCVTPILRRFVQARLSGRPALPRGPIFGAPPSRFSGGWRFAP